MRIEPGFPAEAVRVDAKEEDFRRRICGDAALGVVRVGAFREDVAVGPELVVGGQELLAGAVGNVVAQVVRQGGRLEQREVLRDLGTRPRGQELRPDAVVALAAAFGAKRHKPVSAPKTGGLGLLDQLGDVRQIFLVRFHR